MKKSYGFTLAEVLIVLAIIGVVAVLTLPPIFNSISEDRMKANSNKAFAVIANAISLRHTMTNITPDMYAGSCGSCPEGRLAGYFTVSSKTPGRATFVVNPAWSKPVLKTHNCSTDGSNTVCKFEGNVIASFPNTGVNGTSGCINSANGCMITIDTNGPGGPTRTPNGKSPTGSGGWTTTCVDTQMANGNTYNSAKNTCPDVIQISISGTRITPSNQRTMNILKTGDATKDK